MEEPRIYGKKADWRRKALEEEDAVFWISRHHQGYRELDADNFVYTQVYEPLLVVGLDKFAQLDIRVRVSGGGHTSQI